MLETLKTRFGFNSFRPMQREIIEATVDGRDCLVVLPMASGKSLCYTMPAIVQGRTMLVVSPLLSLIEDQLELCRAQGVIGVALKAGQNNDEVVEAALKGAVSLIYVTPEKITHWQDSLSLLGTRGALCGVAIDEAHCISTWGHDFRPAYKELQFLKKLLPRVPIMALTATATLRVQEDIIATLGLENAFRATSSFDRPNLKFLVKRKDRKEDLGTIVQCIQEHARDQPCIVYGRTVTAVEEISAILKRASFKAEAYHAQLQPEDRSAVQKLFSQGSIQVIVATVAFGMGVNIPNVRLVLHWGAPGSAESYFQEAGRGGRDGQPSVCVMLWSEADFQLQHRFVANYEGKSREIAEDGLKFMHAYCNSSVCRRRMLLSRFGEQFQSDNCGNCDVCCATKPMNDVTDAARIVINTLKEFCDLSATALISIVLGKVSAKMRQEKRYDKCSTYGRGEVFKKSDEWWKELLGGLVSQHYVSMQMRAWKKNNFQRSYACYNVGTVPLTGSVTMLMEGATLPTQAMARQDTRTQPTSLLKERLQKLARGLAIDRRLALHHICSALSIEQMSATRPATIEELSQCDGWGYDRCQMYGEYFVKSINEYCASAGLGRDTVPSSPKRAKLSVHQKCLSCCFILNLADMVFCQLCGKRL